LTTKICDLVAVRRLGLRLLTGADEQEREIRSIHTTDLPNAARYVLPGELVLTNGLWHGRVPADRWVVDLCEVGATALGFGLGAPHGSVPGDVVAACERSSLPLLEVPEELSFASIADWIVAAHMRDERTVLRRHLERAREIVRGLSDGRGAPFLLRLLRDQTGLDSAVVSPGGHVLASIGPELSVEDAARAATHARERHLPSEVEPGLTAFGAGVHQGRLAPVLLVRARPSEIDDETRVVINQVSDHLELEAGWRRSERQAIIGVAQEFVDLLRGGTVSAHAYSTRVAAVGLDPARPITVIAFVHEVAEVGAALEAVGGPFALAPLGDAVIALAQPSSDQVIAEAARAIVTMGRDPTIGGGGSGADATQVGRSVSEALIALQLARGRGSGQRVVRHGDLGSHALLLALLDPEVLGEFREQVLGQVERWDSDHGTDLMETLRLFLLSGGHWRPTAARLHIHHNTLRYRLRRVEELTARDLDDVADRLDMQIALLVPGP